MIIDCHYHLERRLLSDDLLLKNAFLELIGKSR